MFRTWLAAMTMLLPVFALQNLFVWRLPPMRLARTGPSGARTLVIDFLSGLEEGRVGFPSGFFVVGERADGRIVADEMVSWQTTMLALAKRIVRAAWVFGPIGAFMAIVVVLAFGVTAGVAVVIVEFLAKAFLRWRITATVVAVPGTADSAITFTTRGPSAHLLRHRIERAFDMPRLPDDIRMQALGPLWTTQRAGGASV
jgi:hypothetical protein